MKTLTAVLAHAGIGAIQAVSGALYFDPNHPVGALGNTSIQLGLQTAFLLLQGFLAKRNSDTDPKGNTLVVAPQPTAIGDIPVYKTEIK